jgi:hypothetical protein
LGNDIHGNGGVTVIALRLKSLGKPRHVFC